MSTIYLPLVATKPAPRAESEAERMAAIFVTADWQQRANPRPHPLLTAAAQAKADEMAQLVYASHISPMGVWPNDNVRAHGYPLPDWYKPGENNVESFAAGYDTAEDVIAAWKTSVNHWRHVSASHKEFAKQECFAVGYANTPDKGFQHYWVLVTAPCPETLHA